MQLRYKGPLAAVEIAATGQTVARGATVDVEDRKVSDALLAQTDTWTKSSKKTTATADEGDSS